MLIVGVRASTCCVFLVQDGPETVGLNAFRAQLGVVGGAGSHGRQCDGAGEHSLRSSFEGMEKLRIEAGGFAGFATAASAAICDDLHLGIVNQLIQVVVELRHVLIGKGADIECRFGFGGDYVGAETGLDDGGRDGCPEHRVFGRVVLG